MATPHSLPSSPQSHRTSLQLPFAPTPSPAHSQQRFSITMPGPSSGSISSGVPPSRPNSAEVLRSRPPQGTSHSGESGLSSSGLPSSVSSPTLQLRPSAHTSTHTGGILPPASFFRPSRPSYPPPSPTIPHMHRASVGSVMSSDVPIIMDAVRLTRLSEDPDASEATESVGHSTQDAHTSPINPAARAATVKPSREPLLPIGPRRPSVNTQVAPYGTHDSSLSPGGVLRGSFEKLFKRSSNTSHDGMRRSPAHPSPTSPLGLSVPTSTHMGGTSPISPATAARMTFELNVQTRRKQSSSLPPDSESAHTLEFIPTPPSDNVPPLAATPVVDARTGRCVRVWERHPSRNRFFLSGHILTGGDAPWAFIASLTVVLGITGVWFGTTCVWWWRNESPAVAVIGAYMCLLTISSMASTAFRDPGAIPRNLDPDPPYAAQTSSESLRALPRDIRIRTETVRTKYCQTCRTYRPPRSSHCKMCDNCVEGCDHHCQWVNNCVGKRNYTSFFTFLLSAVLTLIIVICTTAIHLYLLTRAPFRLSFRRALQTTEGGGSAAAFVMSILVIWPVMALLLYHSRLLLLNVTTIEQIRNQAHKSLFPGPAPINPFSHGSWQRNLVYVLCRPAGYSWLDAAAVLTEDRREVNPGLLRDAEGGSAVGDAWTQAMEEGRGMKVQ